MAEPKNSEQQDMTRRDAAKLAAGATAAAAIVGAPWIQRVKAANNQVQMAIIGTGGRGQYHIEHLNGLDGGRLVAAVDIYQANLDKGTNSSKDKPKGYKDYREVLNRNDIDAVLIATPLSTHFPITKDALLAGKHVFCEKSLVHKPEEIHMLRKMANERPKQVLQVGLQRRYSRFYQAARQMVDKGLLGDVTNVYAQWHRNLINVPSATWTMKKNDPRGEEANWRLLSKYSGGLVAELGSHQMDIADWMFGSHFDSVTGVGGIDYFKDGRDVFDSVQLIFRYPKGQRLMASYISTNQHLPLFGGSRPQFGEMIMGTEGTIHITVGTDNPPALGIWYREPPKKTPTGTKAAVASASLASLGSAGSKALPILLSRDEVSDQDSFMQKELKFARRWLYSKGVMLPEEDRNPVDQQMIEFWDCVRTGARPKADLEIGLSDSAAVILSNLSMKDERKYYRKEIDTMGNQDAKPGTPAKKG
ncbi:MAG: Gfo/Idh/MocA family oxidoreductase [Acidobacteria bacterium]|nr:Gfo/Idh/MocA family oxidoreductase [Acidobacteriota bacterium]